jgi:hypothetical protein
MAPWPFQLSDCKGFASEKRPSVQCCELRYGFRNIAVDIRRPGNFANA